VIAVIAGATCREMVRSRTFIILLAIYGLAVALSRLVGWISSTDGNIVTTDVVFSLQSIFGVLVAVATGTVLMYSEIQQQTLYTILSRPVPRWHFVVGKYLGMSLGLAAGQLAMLVIGLAYLLVTGAEVHVWLLVAGLLTTVEVLVMGAVSLCLTTLSTPLLAAVLGLAAYALGHAVHTLPELIHYLSNFQQLLVCAIASLIPDLGQFAYRNEAVYRTPLAAADLLSRLAYGGLWITLLVTLTVAVFRRRQL
jgi:ABC-type transport system involved in multi-copper enzyme maturation permease subunit